MSLFLSDFVWVTKSGVGCVLERFSYSWRAKGWIGCVLERILIVGGPRAYGVYIETDPGATIDGTVSVSPQ